jgi:hypothetical protein
MISPGFKPLLSNGSTYARYPSAAEKRVIEIDAELAQIEIDKVKLDTITMDEVGGCTT